jgi:hypothetical protein
MQIYNELNLCVAKILHTQISRQQQIYTILNYRESKLKFEVNRMANIHSRAKIIALIRNLSIKYAFFNSTISDSGSMILFLFWPSDDCVRNRHRTLVDEWMHKKTLLCNPSCGVRSALSRR